MVMTLGQLVASYINYLQHERQLAPRTVAIYRYELDRLVAFLPATVSVNRIDAYQLKDYLAHLREEKSYRPASLGRVCSIIRGLFSYGFRHGYLTTNPAGGLRRPKLPRRLPVYLTGCELPNLINSARADDPVIDIRNRTIIGLCLMTGLRVSELIGLDLDDVEQSDGFLRVMGKGRKERLIPFNTTTRELMAAYLRIRRNLTADGPALFLAKDGGRMTVRMVQYLVKKSANIAALDRRLSPHKLRHTFATSLYGQAVNLREIQELLGHASIASTSVYTHTNVDRVRAAVNRLKL